MRVVESDCVDCDLPCIFEACPHYKVIRYYCDNCQDESPTLYIWDNKQLCLNCIEEQLERIDQDE